MKSDKTATPSVDQNFSQLFKEWTDFQYKYFKIKIIMARTFWYIRKLRKNLKFFFLKRLKLVKF